jgi:hypothetical protein
MKPSSRPTRKPANLSDSVHQQLNMYALAAGAAGVSLLALPRTAEAKIVYRHVHVNIGSYQLNPAGEAVAPFGIYQVNSSFSTNFYWARLSFNPASSGAKFVRGAGSSWSVSALPQGAVIDSKARWGGYRGLVATYGPYGGGTFKHHKGGFQFGRPAFVGFKFQIKGKPHYGWARLTARVGQGRQKYVYAILTGYAYETVPNKAIKAGQTKGMANDFTATRSLPNSHDFAAASMINPVPEISQPVSLGMLALGAQGVPLLRRKESVGATQ